MSVTFTKLFSSITESTIWCESADIRIVWITMLAMSDKNGRVWGSIPGLANRAQVSIESTEKALKRFLSPDKYSRTKDNEGRRITPIDGGWMLLNHAKYRALRDSEERKEYKKHWIAEKRGKGKPVDKPVDKVDQSRPQYTHAEADTDTDTKIKRKGFQPPTLSEVQSYISEKQYSVDPESFIAFYESNGWKVGKNPMKSWKAALTTWQKRGNSDGKNQQSTSKAGRVSDRIDELAREAIDRGEAI